METRRKAQSKQVKFLDVKLLIATASIAVTLGLWNLFSHDAFKAELAPPEPENAPPQDTTSLDLPPLPTLAPLVSQPDLDMAQAAAPGAPAPAGENSSADLPLRSVSADESPVIVQKFKPVVDVPVVNSGGKKGGGSQPVTSTGSSR